VAAQPSFSRLDPGHRASPEEALSLLARYGTAFRRTARRWSLCGADADDAYQRAVEILLTKGPAVELPRLAAWMQVVTRHEALAVRRARERLLGTAPRGESHGADDRGAVEALVCQAPGPAERAERRERFESATRTLAGLSRDQRLAVVLQACGYSYAEIAAARGWTYTKVNRCLAEGRARLRALDAPSEGG
jgi:RNA polymerase sigma factor (sigma-70 family)